MTVAALRWSGTSSATSCSPPSSATATATRAACAAPRCFGRRKPAAARRSPLLGPMRESDAVALGIIDIHSILCLRSNRDASLRQARDEAVALTGLDSQREQVPTESAALRIGGGPLEHEDRTATE